MTIDLKTLPEGAVVEIDEMGRREVRYASGGKTRVSPTGSTFPLGYRTVTRVFVPVPEGMSVEDATQSLADHVQWVPLPDGPTEAHAGARVRFVVTDGPTLTGELSSAGPDPFGAGVSASFKRGWGGTTKDGAFFIHPDDAPTDPDAELIETLAKFIANEAGFVWPTENHAQNVWRNRARAALAVVREHEAGAR